MKFSVCTDAVFASMPTALAMQKVKSAGIDSVEFWNWKNKDIDAIDEARRALDMQIAAFCTAHCVLVDDAAHDLFVQGLRETIPVAKRLDCRMLITTVGDEDPAVARQVQHANIVRGLRRAAPILAENGITLVVEPLNTAADHRGYYLASSDEADEIIREVDSPFVKVLFDFYHQQVTEGHLIARSLAMLPRIGHVHCAGNPGRHELDNGEVNYSWIFEALEKAGYDGYLGLEYFPIRDPEDGLREVLAAVQCKKPL